MPTLTKIRADYRAIAAAGGTIVTLDERHHPTTILETIPRRPHTKPDPNTITLTKRQAKLLDHIAQRTGTTRAHQLKQAILSYSQLREDMPDDEWEDWPEKWP
jgi:hypothetical protein